METISITNAKELQAEILRLKEVETKQKAMLAKRFSSPSEIFQSVRSLFPKKEGMAAGGLLHPDIVNLLSRFALPFALNRTVFRHSNFLVKSLVGLVSQKAAGLVTEDKAATLLSKGKALLDHYFHKGKAVAEHYPVKDKRP